MPLKAASILSSWLAGWFRRPVEIASKAAFPGGQLSNFAPHAFEIDGVPCACMEGFLQSLKFADPEMALKVCAMRGPKAKRTGRKGRWRHSQMLHWRGAAFDRHGAEYQALLDRAYDALFEQSAGFREALAATGTRPLAHSMGRSEPHQTVLTIEEFCGRLARLRSRLAKVPAS
ncbi:MAG: hypothetical protein AB7U38_10450 [Hyphomicrobiales bacterium]